MIYSTNRNSPTYAQVGSSVVLEIASLGDPPYLNYVSVLAIIKILLKIVIKKGRFYSK